ncbi:phage terminase small subunit [Spirillospora sp. NBC_01491]|uniref:phage terminase small subunit n=1 Tax=Spirillospora sp. NBC_01491 TaxID=2976007 RepID=UPI002E3546B4|nr:hypothetical protein [Spirillospora sp. NBC_01491]
MAVPGPPPAEAKRRRNADTYEGHEVTVTEDAPVDAPELPYAGKYSQATCDWYATWCRSPQAATFTTTDWQRLHMIAPLVNAYWVEPSTKVMAEIRLNESLLGATHVDRLRARIKVEKPTASDAAPSGVADMRAARRRRMSDAS